MKHYIQIFKTNKEKIKKSLNDNEMLLIHGGSCSQASTIANVIGIVGVGLLFASFAPVGALAAAVIASQGAVATFVGGGLSIGLLIAC